MAIGTDTTVPLRHQLVPLMPSNIYNGRLEEYLVSSGTHSRPSERLLIGGIASYVVQLARSHHFSRYMGIFPRREYTIIVAAAEIFLIEALEYRAAIRTRGSASPIPPSIRSGGESGLFVLLQHLNDLRISSEKS